MLLASIIPKPVSLLGAVTPSLRARDLSACRITFGRSLSAAHCLRVRSRATTPAAMAHAAEVPEFTACASLSSQKLLGAHKSGFWFGPSTLNPGWLGPCEE